MDEVDGMSAGDRGGVADLIASIKISKIPIICICNDRYSQKLKSLVNYCLLLSFRKPTKATAPFVSEQCYRRIFVEMFMFLSYGIYIKMSKRLIQVANAEGLQVNEIALEELAERVNGDMRMALNQLQYMSLSMSVINYDDVRQRLQGSAKDEDISPFTAVDKLFGFSGGKLRMDERIGLSMSDPDLVPLLIQENYINYRPASIGKDDNGMKRMHLIARAAESIADGDIINVQIRRYRQWQLSQAGSLSSCIIPAALLHGSRETLEQGERNFNRFGGWLGKNSTVGKNLRLLEDLHVHLLASRESNLGRDTLRLDYLTVLLKQLTDPLRMLPKDEAVEKVVEFMNVYSINQEDMDTIVELSKFQGHGNPLDGIPSTVKAALTRAYKDENKSRMVRAADLVALPGKKKALKKRVAAILEPSDDGLREENGDALAESEEENSSDTEDTEGTGNGEKLQSELLSLNSKGIQVEVELKSGKEKSKAKKTPTGRGKGGSASTEKKPAGRGRGGSGSSEKPGAKRKR
ncbi:REPLICATION FACTOR C SUBUNIT 1 [Salix koriyanagi]|uniref:REPLICATION FACTOR C SUBUNIT 1 n=1 Tax=Salix koriyanagi TaxID=2511006 RepID=A0A9Q0V012_9ROSI|nr:REPLICATION FACTOR C SUBUNIT 1 [Salix koriyanagi]